MSVKISPSPRQQFEDANGLPYSGAKLFTYVAGSTTKQATYTTSVGDTANSNPIVLDSAGRTPYGVWLTSGLTYKFVLAPSTDTDPPTSPIFTEDNISGVNDTTVSTSQWISSGLTPTYIGATQFSVVGDQTTELHVNRRLKLTVSAGTVYGKISVSAYTTVTTVTVVLDSGTLDSGLSAVEWSMLSATNNSLPKGIFADLAGATFTGLVNLASGADIASAATINLSTATGNSPRITGTVATSAVTMSTGQKMSVVADGAWPLTYHATTNKLNTGADYTCKAGDVIRYHKDLSGVVHGEISRPTGVTAGTVLQADQAITTIASAATTTLGTTAHIEISGTASITAFNGVAGMTYHCKATGEFTITHNGAVLSVLQGGVSIGCEVGATFDIYMLTATTCEASNFVRARQPEGSWSDYSASSTVVGFSSFTTKSIYQKRVGNVVHVGFDITGTSNSTSTTFTLQNANAAGVICTGILGYNSTDNSASLSTDANFLLNPSSSTVTCYTNRGGSLWTASGTKRVNGSFTYQI